MIDYYDIIKFIFKYENLYTEEKKNYGICLRILPDKNNIEVMKEIKNYILEENDIDSLSRDEIEELYKIYFWDTYQFDFFKSGKISFVIFDSDISLGSKVTNELIQRTLKDMKYKITITSIFDQQTATFLKKVDEEKFIDLFMNKRRDYYSKIKIDDEIKNGWFYRLDSIMEDLKDPIFNQE